MLTGHITESLLTIVGSHVWAKLTDDEKKIFEEVLAQAAGKATDAIRASEQKLVDEFKKLGKNVVEVGSRGVPRRGPAAAQRWQWRLDPGGIRRAAGGQVGAA